MTQKLDAGSTATASPQSKPAFTPSTVPPRVPSLWNQITGKSAADSRLAGVPIGQLESFRFKPFRAPFLGCPLNQHENPHIQVRRFPGQVSRTPASP